MKNEKMKLEQMVAEVHKYGNDTAIVEFMNGYGVLYEKAKGPFDRRLDNDEFLCSPPTSVLSTIFPPDRLLEFVWEQKCGLTLAKINGFSPAARKLLKEYRSPSYERIKGIDPRLNAICEEMLAPLEIKPFNYMDMRKDLPSGVYLPIPLSLAIMAATIPSELLNPTGRAYKITKKEHLLEKNPGKYPELYYNGVGIDFNPNFIYDPANLVLLFPPRDETGSYITLSSKFGAATLKKAEESYFRAAQMYAQAKCFLRVEDKLQEEAYILINQREKEYALWQEFKDGLNKENQTALLTAIGFLTEERL